MKKISTKTATRTKLLLRLLMKYNLAGMCKEVLLV
jgi:hypothetical protein